MSVGADKVAGLLGLERRGIETNLQLATALEKGLPVGAFDRVCKLVAPDDPAMRDLLVARATLARRKQQKRLSSHESEKVERLARVWAMAMDVWKEPDAARRFLGEPHAMLDGRTPREVAARTDLGARTVEQILGRLAYGSAA